MRIEHIGVAEYIENARNDPEWVSEYYSVLFERIGKVEPEINSYITLADPEKAVKNAVESAKRKTTLAGLPVAVKDNISTRGMKTTCGSRILSNYIPPYDATAVRSIKEHGGVILGKTNLDEFAMGSTTETSFYGPTRNPWDLDRVPGGSSGGSAAAVAARIAPVSLGSDTGGSVRNPASFTGTVGFKPTYGVISRYGLIAYASSLDQIGIIGLSVEDIALLLDIVSGEDPRDSTSIAYPSAKSFHSSIKDGDRYLGDFKAVLVSEMWRGVDPDVNTVLKAVIGKLESNGLEVTEISIPEIEYALPTYYIIAMAEASSNLARYSGMLFGISKDPSGVDWVKYYSRIRGIGFGREVKRRIILGSYILSEGFFDQYYLKALKIRRLLKQRLVKVYGDHGFIISPTTPITAPRLGENIDDPLKLYALDVETVVANLVGGPSISVPAGFAGGLPVGLQITGPPLSDLDMLALAYRIEEIIGSGKTHAPPLG